jgi:hypothetical protein
MARSLSVLWEKNRALDELVREWRKSDSTALDLQSKITAAEVRANADRVLSLAQVVDDRIKALVAAVGELRRLVYIGVGIVLAIQLAILVYKK